MPLPQEQRYTFADLLQWDDNVRYELYYGVPVALASPSDTHQNISGEIHYQLTASITLPLCIILVPLSPLASWMLVKLI